MLHRRIFAISLPVRTPCLVVARPLLSSLPLRVSRTPAALPGGHVSWVASHPAALLARHHLHQHCCRSSSCSRRCQHYLPTSPVPWHSPCSLHAPFSLNLQPREPGISAVSRSTCYKHSRNQKPARPCNLRKYPARSRARGCHSAGIGSRARSRESTATDSWYPWATPSRRNSSLATP